MQSYSVAKKTFIISIPSVMSPLKFFHFAKHSSANHLHFVIWSLFYEFYDVCLLSTLSHIICIFLMSFQSEDAIFEQETLSIYQSLSFSYVQSLFDMFCHHKRNQKRTRCRLSTVATPTVRIRNESCHSGLSSLSFQWNNSHSHPSFPVWRQARLFGW
jgi:hypothetical protein